MAARNINKNEFELLIHGEKPVLVDFWAPWCSYCRRIENAYQKVAENFSQQAEIVKVNIDDEPALAQQERIEVIPTLVLYKNGQAVDSIVAPESKAKIEDFLLKNL